ncbi:MAG: hypothetical protein AAF456_17400 [Planctomycetota bacterium]
MNTVEQFDELIARAMQAGYRIRYDYFGGTGGGVCQFGGARWLFVDLALNVVDRLDQLQSALREDSFFVEEVEQKAA